MRSGKANGAEAEKVTDRVPEIPGYHGPPAINCNGDLSNWHRRTRRADPMDDPGPEKADSGMERFLLHPRDVNAEVRRPEYDKADFARRWRLARLSAIRAAASLPGHAGEMDEAAALEAFLSAARLSGEERRSALKDALLRHVFDNSRLLASGLSRRLGVTFEVEDFRDLLEAVGVPCVQGRWTARPEAQVLARPGCGFCPGAGADACDYWREALDGLVTGLGGTERMVRQGCLRRGDAECVDVLFPEAPRGAREAEAWAPVPGHMAVEIFEAAQRLGRSAGAEVSIKGLREGVLCFEFLGATDGNRCGGAVEALERFREALSGRFPGLGLMDVTPRAVMGGGEA